MCGVFLLLSIAFESSSAPVYALAVFVVATLITELDFLSKLAAIFWNRPWAYARPATTHEILSSGLREAQIEGGTTSADDAPAAKDQLPNSEHPAVQEESTQHAESGFEYEQRALEAISQTGLFDDLQLETAITTLDDPSRSLMVVDALGKRGDTKYVIEIKRRLTSPLRVAQQIQYAITALKNTPEFRRKFFQERFRGIVVTPRTGKDARIGGDIICLFFDPDSGAFSNLEAVRNWMAST